MNDLFLSYAPELNMFPPLFYSPMYYTFDQDNDRSRLCCTIIHIISYVTPVGRAHMYYEDR